VAQVRGATPDVFERGRSGTQVVTARWVDRATSTSDIIAVAVKTKLIEPIWKRVSGVTAAGSSRW